MLVIFFFFNFQSVLIIAIFGHGCLFLVLVNKPEFTLLYNASFSFLKQHVAPLIDALLRVEFIRLMKLCFGSKVGKNNTCYISYYFVVSFTKGCLFQPSDVPIFHGSIVVTSFSSPPAGNL